MFVPRAAKLALTVLLAAVAAATIAALVSVVRIAARGEDAPEQECGPGAACGTLSATVFPDRVRGTMATSFSFGAPVDLAEPAEVTGPGGAACRERTVRLRVPAGGSRTLTPAAFGSTAWCEGPYRGRVRLEAGEALGFSWRAARPPATRIVDRAAPFFLALRAPERPSPALSAALAAFGPRARADAAAVGGEAGVAAVLVPRGRRLCLLLDARGTVRRVCRTLEQARRRDVLAVRIRTRSGDELAVGVLPDGAASVRLPARGSPSLGPSRLGFFVVDVRPGQRPTYLGRVGKRVTLQIPPRSR